MKELLIFKAQWCVPCGQLEKTMQGIDLGLTPKYINVDLQAQEAKMHNVRGVPTLILLQNGVETKRKSGAMTAEQLKEFIS